MTSAQWAGVNFQRSGHVQSFTQVQIDFSTSHLIFPYIVVAILGLLGLAILVTRWQRISGAGVFWRSTLEKLDAVRLFGSIALTVIYFLLMVPIGDFWPNTGLGFLLCSVPYVFLTGLLFMHAHNVRQIWPLAVVALVAPLLVWWLFTDIFFLTLP